MASSQLMRLRNFYLSDSFENTALVCKFCVLLAILINSVCLIPHYYPIYESNWLERIPEGIRVQPNIFLIMGYLNNSIIIRFFLFAEILALINAMRHLRSTAPMMLVIFFP